MSQSPSDLEALKLWCSLIPFKFSISEYQWMLDQICFVVESISVDSRLFVSFFWQGPDHLHPHRDWFAPHVESKTSGSIIPWNHVILLVAIHINHLNHMLQVTRHHALEKQSLYGVPWRRSQLDSCILSRSHQPSQFQKNRKKRDPNQTRFFHLPKLLHFWDETSEYWTLQKITSKKLLPQCFHLIPALPSARPWFWFLRSDARVVGHGHWSPLAALTSRGGREVGPQLA